MIKELSKVTFTETDRDDPFRAYRKEIEEFWAYCCRENPDAYSEEILNVFDVRGKDKEFILDTGKIDFYEGFFSKHTGKIKASPLFSGGYLKTRDGYFCLALDKDRNINLIGGLASLTDYKDGIYDPDICLAREFLEETGCDIREGSFSYSIKYIKVPDEDEAYSPTGLIYEVKTSYGNDEIYKIFRESRHDSELSSLIFFLPDEEEIFRKNNRRPYINSLFDLLR